MNFRGSREGGFHQPGRPHSEKNETLKFEDDYDFQQANEQFKEVFNKSNTSNFHDPNGENPSYENNKYGKDAVAATVTEDDDNDRKKSQETFYDKQTSFFDSISCEALERSKGKLVRNDWRDERRLNKETFGEAGTDNSRFGHGGRGGFINNGGSRGFNNHGGHGYSRGRGFGFGRGGQGMGQNGFRSGYDNGGGSRGGFGWDGYGGQRGRGSEGQRGYGGLRGFERNIGREFGRGGLGQRGAARGGLIQGFKRPV